MSGFSLLKIIISLIKLYKSTNGVLEDRLKLTLITLTPNSLIFSSNLFNLVTTVTSYPASIADRANESRCDKNDHSSETTINNFISC